METEKTFNYLVYQTNGFMFMSEDGLGELERECDCAERTLRALLKEAP